MKSVSAIVLGFSLFALSKAFTGADAVKLADVNGHAVYAADVEKSAGKALFEQRERLYRVQKQKLDEYVTAILLTEEAKKRGKSVEALLNDEVNSKIMPVGDDEIEAFYRLNATNLSSDSPEAREHIRQLLHYKKFEAQTALYLRSLRSKGNIRTYLQPPAPYRVQVPITEAPSKGPEGASVTIVTFEDYQCPFCVQVQPLLARLFKQYRGKIRLVHKDFPMDSIHPQARLAAEAGRCAHRQGKFWPFHELVYANSPKVSPKELDRFMAEVGGDLQVFKDCLSRREMKDLVERDTTDAAQLGVTDTPTFFINGREITGFQPLEKFEAVIAEELRTALN